MEDNAISRPHHSHISTRVQPSDAETGNLTIFQPSRGQMKAMEPTGQWTKIHEESFMLKCENARLIKENQALIQNLEDCKAEFFNRMPHTPIPDASIQKAVGKIRDSIDNFVYDTMGSDADDALYKLCQRKQQKQKRRRSHNGLSHFIRTENISAWGPYECSNFYILSVIIQWILDEFVFVHKLPMGISDVQIRVLEDVEKSMRHASQAQTEQDRFDIWRSETLTALTVLPANEIRLEGASKRICNRLNDVLSPWLGDAGPFAKVEERFRREILDPAIKLHQDLRSSSNRYRIEPPTGFEQLPLKQIADEFELKDADTWQRAKGEKEVGKALYCLHPSIIRLRARGTTPIVVAKSVIVVIGPERARDPNSYNIRSNSKSFMTAAQPALIESSLSTDTSSPEEESPTQHRFPRNPPPMLLTDSDSTTDSRRRRRLSSHGRRASTHPSTTQKHEPAPTESPQRRITIPIEPSQNKPDHLEDRTRYPRFQLETGDRQASYLLGKPPREDHHQDNTPPQYLRGHPIQGSSYSHRTQAVVAAARQQPPSRRPSRDASIGRSSPHRPIANESLQPPTAPSSPVSSTGSVKSRGLIERFRNR